MLSARCRSPFMEAFICRELALDARESQILLSTLAVQQSRVSSIAQIYCRLRCCSAGCPNIMSWSKPIRPADLLNTLRQGRCKRQRSARAFRRIVEYLQEHFDDRTTRLKYWSVLNCAEWSGLEITTLRPCTPCLLSSFIRSLSPSVYIYIYIYTHTYMHIYTYLYA